MFSHLFHQPFSNISVLIETLHEIVLIPLNLQGWRICYFGTGALAVIMAILTGTTLKEPERQAIGEDSNNQNARKKVSLYKVLTQPRIILLAIAASIRHCGGMTFAYNADLYYSIYFPDVDLGWWLFGVTIVIGKFKKRMKLSITSIKLFMKSIIGSIGVVAGGIVSDKIVAKMGIKSRVAVLAISQLISTPGAFGSVYFEPVWAMVTLGISYFFGKLNNLNKLNQKFTTFRNEKLNLI